MNDRQVVRIGILGAARIAPMALIRPARKLSNVSVAAIASRDPAKAASFAQKHGVAKVHQTYEDMLCDPEIDAVYIPLPISLHAPWSIRSLQAGKHVLCEKPLASNADQASELVEAATVSQRVLCEGMHYRFHPLAARIKEIVTSGQLGTVQRVESELCVPLFFDDEVRYRFELSGGATMEVGCYAINIMRFLAGEEPEVVSATAALASEQIDKQMSADFQFPSGATGRIHCSIRSFNVLRSNVTVTADQGRLRVFNPFMPQMMCHRMRVRDRQGSRTEHVSKEPTFDFQLREFIRAIQAPTPSIMNSEDAVQNLRIIDQVYRRAGLSPRGVT